MPSKETSKTLHEAVAELYAAREAARLKMHLFSMDARTAWDELERKFATLTVQLEQSSRTGLRLGARTLRGLPAVASRLRGCVSARLSSGAVNSDGRRRNHAGPSLR